jgi:hypothetical protein
MRHRRPDERQWLPRLCRTSPGADPQARRRRRAGQSQCPQGAGAREAIEAAGANPLYLPPYSPDFNPIEQIFAKLKALLRKERSVEALWNRIACLLDAFSMPSSQMNALTTSASPDMLQVKWKLL